VKFTPKYVSVRDGTTNEHYESAEQGAGFGKLLRFLSRRTVTHLARYCLDKWRLRALSLTYIWTIIWGVLSGTEILLSSGRSAYQVYRNLRPSIFLVVTWSRLEDAYGRFGLKYLSMSRRLLDCLAITDNTKNISETSVSYYQYTPRNIQQERRLEIQTQRIPGGFPELGTIDTWRW
jgi:hypothetical protein